MLNPALIGKEYWSATVTVEAGAVLRFARASGDASLGAGPGPVEAPPAFVLSLVPFDAFTALLDPAARQVHTSELQVELSRPVLAGDRLQLRSKVVDVVHHPGAVAANDVVTVDDEGKDPQTGEVVYRARRVYAVLGPREGA